MSARAAGTSRFVGNTAALAISAGVAMVLTLGQMKLLAAHLSLAAFGLFASLRGLSLLVSMLAANGFPQVLVRFLPEFAARGAHARALRVTAAAVASTLFACVVLLAGVALLQDRFFREVQVDAAFLGWFSLTTLAVALKLVLYGGFNGLRRFGTQTVLETGALALQVAWMVIERDSLTITSLFRITGITSILVALLAVPWFGARLRAEIPPAGDGARAPWAGYWGGAVGLSVVALAFTDVDRWVLSNVLAFESLSMFHVASRIVRLTNRFIAMPVLAFQPEVTRVYAQGRGDAVALATSAFFKACVVVAVFAAAAIAVYARPLILLAANDAYLGARTTLWLMAASIPLSAMTAPLTAVMKALDAVRSALYCDLVWAGAYVALLLGLASRLGLDGAGVAQLAASAVQLVVTIRLATVRPALTEMTATLAKAIACAIIAFAPAIVLDRTDSSPVVMLAAGPLACGLYFVCARRVRVLAPDERERVRAIVSGQLGSGWARLVP